MIWTPMLWTLLSCSQAVPVAPAPSAPVAAPVQDAVVSSLAQGVFAPPERGDYPEGEFGEAVKRGEALFHDVQTHAPEYSGNTLTCSNCHLDDGRRADAAPMWAAMVKYPAYRGKNKHVNDMDERIRGCFTYSMNGQASPHGSAPPAGDPKVMDLQAYFFWLAQGATLGSEMKGQGFPKLQEPTAVSAQAGEALYEQHCTVCHGEQGQGTLGPAGEVVFPPLWGPESYNWGAGMHRVNTAAGFIFANMPLGQPGTLSEQESWDLAAYINSHQRPPDPRDKAGVQATDSTFHEHNSFEHNCDYGEQVDGQRLGAR